MDDLQEPPSGEDAASKTEASSMLKFAGMFKDDPFFERWQRAIEEYRRKVDSDPDYL